MILDTAEAKVTFAKKLQDGGFDGLFVSGECACEICDLMPCGVAERDDDEEWVNGCEPGYKVADPSGKTDDFVIMRNKREITQEEFDETISRV